MVFPILLCIDDLPQRLPLRKESLKSCGYLVKTTTSQYVAMKESPSVALLLEYKAEGMDARPVASHIKLHFALVCSSARCCWAVRQAAG